MNTVDTDIHIEEAVVNFAKRMQHKLDKNRFKPSKEMNPGGKGRTWTDCDLLWLLRRLREETLELEEALYLTKQEEVLDEAADVGNFAMMIHDIVSRTNEGEAAKGCE